MHCDLILDSASASRLLTMAVCCTMTDLNCFTSVRTEVYVLAESIPILLFVITNTLPSTAVLFPLLAK